MADQKVKVLFDASVLANGAFMTTARSGVFFVAYNLLLEMLKRENLSVTVYCNPLQRHLFDLTVKNDTNLKGLNMFEYSNFEKSISKLENLRVKNKKNKGSQFAKFFIKTGLFLSKKVSKLQCALKLRSKIYSDFDFFFSPWGIIPDEIKGVESLKKMVLMHDVIPLLFPENFPDVLKKNTDLYKLFHVFDKNTIYLANSEYTKQDLIKYAKIPAETTSVIPLSTGKDYKKVQDLSEIGKIKEKYKIPIEKKYIFSLCSLEPRKNLIFAVKNFINFVDKNQIEDFVFVLGGGAWDIFIDKLNETIENSEKYKDKIIKIGYVEDEDLSALYSGADMFVSPSVYEGFGMPILEAMKCGCPVICSNLTSMPEVIGDCGIQIDPKSDDDLIKAYEKMYFDNNFRAQCSEKGIQRAKIFSWENSVNTILKGI